MEQKIKITGNEEELDELTKYLPSDFDKDQATNLKDGPLFKESLNTKSKKDRLVDVSKDSLLDYFGDDSFLLQKEPKKKCDRFVYSSFPPY